MVVDSFKTHGSYSDFGYLSQEAGDNNHKTFHLYFIPFITLIQKNMIFINHMGYWDCYKELYKHYK